MARRKKSPSSAGSETSTLVSQIVSMHMDAGLTIAMRLPLLVNGALGDRHGLREATTAVTEKLSAVSESGLAAGQAAVQLWWQLVLSPAGMMNMPEAAAKVANSAMEPFSRRARANAARLSSRSR